ncbi:hypothetical protein F4861DRAFT_362885 [Xylaria intraflava]|nr:hypothetical protein F4861DRAFT_362885 [Xylaria intraflava]
MSGYGDYKPYTTPYTGAGAVRTEHGWVNCRDYGPPGATSGPGKRPEGGGPVPAFHYAEVVGTSTSKPPPSNYDIQQRPCGPQPSRRPITLPGSNTEIKGIKGPDGLGFDLPKYHEDLANMSNREIALKIGLLHIKKGNIHENMHQAATNQEILSLDPNEQILFRNENIRELGEIEVAIRAWEGVQATRAASMPKPSLQELMRRQGPYGGSPSQNAPSAQNQQSTRDVDDRCSPHSSLSLDAKKKKKKRRDTSTK